MTMKNPLILIMLAAILIFAGCEINKDDKPIELSGDLYILCEGNFGSENASLWSADLDNEETEINPNIYEALTGNNLGDVANAMYINNDQLYIINNNSHTIEILKLGEDDAFTLEASVDIAYSSPRFMAFKNDKGFITTWYNGILVLDLNSNSITDTISISGMPEDILINGNDAYVSVSMNSDWTANNEVLRIDITDLNSVSIDTYYGIPGPGKMELIDGNLYVACTYYDIYWSANYGLNKIELSTGNMSTYDHGSSFSFGSDIVSINDQLYRSTSNGLMAINADLTVDEQNIINGFSGVYAVAVNGENIFFGTTDYIAPDTVYVTDLTGNIEHIFEIGALPTDFSVFSD